MNKPKLCLYCDRWQNGGVEAFLMTMLRHWDLEALPCDLMVSEVTTDLYDQELEALGVRRVVTLQKQYPSPIRRILANLRAIGPHLRQGGYDALYLHLSNSFTMIYAWIAKRQGIPVRFVHSHCADLVPGPTLPLKRLASKVGQIFFSKSVTDFFACSEEAGSFLFGEKASRSGKITLVNNAIDIGRFTPSKEKRDKVRANLGLNLEGQRIIGTVGRFTAQKNTAFLLEAFALYGREGPGASLLLVGEGPLAQELKNKAQELDIASRVIFYGTTPDIPAVLSAMDVFCLPSLFEGNPVSIIEAQAAGLPCLVSAQVTPQCQVTDNVMFLPVDEGVDPWAEAMGTARVAVSPEVAARQVEEHGYGGAAVSRELQRRIVEAIAGEGGVSR